MHRPSTLWQRILKCAGSLTILLTTSLSPVSAQSLFRDVLKLEHIPKSESRDTSRPQYADIDGDGDLDFALTSNGSVLLYQNLGDERFVEISAQAIAPGIGRATDLTFVNLPGWKHPAIVITYLGGKEQTRLLTTGATTHYFDSPLFPPDPYSAHHILSGDVNGDGNPDLLLAGYGREVLRLYLSDSLGQFHNATQTNIPATTGRIRDMVFADLDQDQDLDLILARGERGSSLRNQVFINQGGVFSDRSNVWLTGLANVSSAVAAGDVDGDGDIDVVFALQSPHNRDLLLLNTGTSLVASTNPLLSRLDEAEAVTLVDLDGDQDLDLIIDTYGSAFCLLNNGSGQYKAALTGFYPVESLEQATTPCDIDGDGDTDLLVGGIPNLYLNDNNRRFVPVNKNRLDILPEDAILGNGIAMVDVDGDGDLDAVFGGGYRTASLLTNDGLGNMTLDKFAFPPQAGSGKILDMAFGDLDGDGDPDLMAACVYGIPMRLFINYSRGHYREGSLSHIPNLQGAFTAVSLGDLDGDGDLDALFGAAGGGTFAQNRILINNGRGQFKDETASRLPIIQDDTQDLILGDLDNDGDLDLVVANSGERNWILINNGKGIFTASKQLAVQGGELSQSLALGDIDLDGDLDLFVGNTSQANRLSRNRIYLNDGAAGFTDVSQNYLPVAPGDSSDAHLIDADEDGDLDLLLSYPLRLLTNDGTGRMIAVPGHEFGYRQINTKVACGDFDRDGDLDLIATAYWTRPRYSWFNHRRQIRAPLLARTGKVYEIEVQVTPDRLASRTACVLVASTGIAARPTSLPGLGLLMLDTRYLIPTPSLRLNALGEGLVTFSIPTNTGLIGNKIAFQGIAANDITGPLRLTNAIQSTIEF